MITVIKQLNMKTLKLKAPLWTLLFLCPEIPSEIFRFTVEQAEEEGMVYVTINYNDGQERSIGFLEGKLSEINARCKDFSDSITEFISCLVAHYASKANEK